MRNIISKRNSLLLSKNVLYARNSSTKSLGLWNEELTDSIRHKIEEHWKPKLKKKYLYDEDDKKSKFYVLSMFPYPSGNLHMGHVRVYTISDTIARFHRMLGKNVFHPMGWDAFGLPAENAANIRNVSPDNWTRENIKTMKHQLEALQCSFCWDKELATCHPGYYKFTQYIFLKLFEEGLVYQRQALVNWDPIDKTVLADEQVDEQGCSWRSGAKVEKKPLKQWFVRTTKFAKSLCDGLDDPNLEGWRDIVKMQRNWIGDCNGTVFDFGLEGPGISPGTIITVWTSKPEHMSRSKYIVVAPGSLVDKLCEGESCRRLNCDAINPLSGEHIPVFVSDKVEFEEGTDCKLGIPDAFEADYRFAKTIGIPVDEREVFFGDDCEIRQKVCDEALSKNCGGYLTSSNLRDWLISRQRYWGTPIPLVHCNNCGVQPISYDNLPVLLPTSHKRSSTLADFPEWIKTTCPKCKGEAKRETDTMDTFVDSSWYYLRYLDPRNDSIPFSKEIADTLFPVDIYVGGKEHATLHLYYARFMSHFLHSIGWIKEKEPFKRLLVQGMIMGKTYRIKGSGKYLKESEVVKKDDKITVHKETGEAVIEQWEKMSKSKFNGVEPADMLKVYGIDTTRLLVLADVAPTSNRHWNERTFPGMVKWQHRLWLTVNEFIKNRSKRDSIEKSANYIEQEEFVWDSRNYYLKGITFHYTVTHLLSIAISKMQGLTGSLRKSSPDIVAFSREYERALVLLAITLAPITPHFASELWAGIREASGRITNDRKEIDWDKPIEEQQWPILDPHYKLKLDCWINNDFNVGIRMLRPELDSLTQDAALKLALNDPAINSHLADHPIKNVQFELFPGYDARLDLHALLPKKKKKDKVKKKRDEKVASAL